MSAISAKDVKALRDQTGAGMMDCKSALSDSGGDVEKAVELLRERGLSKAGKRAGRATSEGSVGISIDDGFGVMIEMGCETDFVARNSQFQGLVQEVADTIRAAGGAADVEAALALPMKDSTVGECIQSQVGVVGENMQLKRVASIQVDGVVSSYVHGGGSLGVLIGIKTGSPETGAALGKDLAMHVAASDPTPLSVDRDSLDPVLVEKERQFLAKQAQESGKPDNIIENMVKGRLNKYYASICLLEQPYVKDPDKKVSDVVKAAGDASVTEFVRFKLGEAVDE